MFQKEEITYSQPKIERQPRTSEDLLTVVQAYTTEYQLDNPLYHSQKEFEGRVKMQKKRLKEE